jgi:hypothetical protein
MQAAGRRTADVIDLAAASSGAAASSLSAAKAASGGQYQPEAMHRF